MISITTNIDSVIGSLKEKVEAVAQTSELMRTIATNMRAVVKDRIHNDGKAADGNQIGTYSNSYLALRTGQYKTNKTFSKGKNKGETKPTGVFTKGKHKGAARPNYNRTNDPKVVISLTRQMENDFVVVATDNGYGLGYNNEENFKKVAYVENTYRKKIFSLTEDEQKLVEATAQEFVDNKINGTA